MKQTTFLFRSLLVTTLMVFSLPGNAQRYEVNRGRVLYGDKQVMHVDVRSFVDLGSGYGQDTFDAYYRGKKIK